MNINWVCELEELGYSPVISEFVVRSEPLMDALVSLLGDNKSVTTFLAECPDCACTTRARKFL